VLGVALEEEGDFYTVFDMYLDLVGSPGFLDQGTPKEDRRLKVVLRQAGRHLIPGPGVPMQQLMMWRSHRLSMYFGLFQCRGSMMNFFYYPAQDRGMVGYVAPDFVTHFLRFSVLHTQSGSPNFVAGNNTQH